MFSLNISILVPVISFNGLFFDLSSAFFLFGKLLDDNPDLGVYSFDIKIKTFIDLFFITIHILKNIKIKKNFLNIILNLI